MARSLSRHSGDRGLKLRFTSLIYAQSAVAAVVFCWAAPDVLAESADEFLAGLRDRGWHDTALDYLDEAPNDPLASQKFLQKLDYERAATQAALARRAPSEKTRISGLESAAFGFAKFAETQPKSPLQLQALATAGNLYAELALYASNKADKLPPAARKQREQLFGSARDYLDQAKPPLAKLKDQCVAKLKTVPKAAVAQKQGTPFVSRQQLEGKLAEAKFLLAKLDFERARTHAKGSNARKQAFKTAEKAFNKLFEEYDDKLVGFYGRFYEGRCLQLAGELKQALKSYLDIVDQPPIPNRDFRRLVSKTYRHRAECHLASDDEDSAINECREWLSEASNEELSEAEWLAVSYVLATAYETNASKSSGNDAQRQQAEARKLYREIAKLPGEFQREAQAKIAATGGTSGKPVDVDSFDEAFAAGKQALERMNSAKLAAKLAADNNPSSVESLSEQAEAEQKTAADYFRQASQLADSSTDREQLATARYYLCWLYWEDGRLDEAAVVGEYLARRYPENKYAPVAAKLALASYERLYNSAKKAGEQASFEAQRLAHVAELLVLRWPESSEAETGLNLLINIALRDNRRADAEALLARLPPASRASAQIRLGSALWTSYLRAANKSKTPSAETQQLKQKAGMLLSTGFQVIKASPQVSTSEATGVLYLAQYLLADGQAAKAAGVLEDPAAGPLSLIKQQSPAVSQPALVKEVYKAALRAYLSTQPPQRAKAQEMMGSLESAIGKGSGAQQKLISIYVSLGLQLQQQIAALTADGQAAKARAVAASFADLLARVTERAGAENSWKVQSWIAQTNLQIGQGLRGKDAEKYFKQASNAYQTLITKAEKDPKFAPSPISLLAAKKKLADCQLAGGEYSAAFQQYALMLKKKPNMLELQQAAASALQQWGGEEKAVKRLEEAIRGAMPQANRKNLVWGWLRIAQIADQAKRRAAKKADSDPKQAERVAKYQDLFFEARLRAAEARYAAAMLVTGAERSKQLQTARKSIETMKRLYPDLGGDKWQSAYLQLIEQMEQEI